MSIAVELLRVFTLLVVIFTYLLQLFQSTYSLCSSSVQLIYWFLWQTSHKHLLQLSLAEESITTAHIVLRETLTERQCIGCPAFYDTHIHILVDIYGRGIYGQQSDATDYFDRRLFLPSYFWRGKIPMDTVRQPWCIDGIVGTGPAVWWWREICHISCRAISIPTPEPRQWIKS